MLLLQLSAPASSETASVHYALYAYASPPAEGQSSSGVSSPPPSPTPLFTPSSSTEAAIIGMTVAVITLPLLLLCLALFRTWRMRGRFSRELHNMTAQDLQRATDANDATVATLRTMAVLPPPEAGVSQKEIDELPVCVYYCASPSRHGDDRCSVCLEDYISGQSEVRSMRCGHAFHSSCITQWLRLNKHCPLCLQPIDRGHDVRRRRQQMEASRGAAKHEQAVEMAEMGERVQGEVEGEAGLGLVEVNLQLPASRLGAASRDEAVVHIWAPEEEEADIGSATQGEVEEVDSSKL